MGLRSVLPRNDDPDDVGALGWPGQVFAPGDWGRLVNGGAWLKVDGEPVDLIYRDLDEVLHWTAEAEHGRFEIQREVGYVAGIATYILAGELSINEVLVGELPRPSFPEPLRHTARAMWYQLAAGALANAQVHAKRDDRVAALANLTQAVLATAHGRLAAAGEWALNEKGLVARAGLADLQRVMSDDDVDTILRQMQDMLGLPTWR